VVVKAMSNGLLVVPAGDNVVRLIPPMTITEEQVAEAMEIMDTTCAQLLAQGEDG